jgi:hypothetical protein
MEFESRCDMVRELVPQGGIYGEIGVFTCEFSKFMKETLKPKELFLFDLYDGSICSGDCDGNNVRYVDMTHQYLEAQKIGKAIKGDSSTCLLQCDTLFDMIYIDGDHSYEGCKKDLLAAYEKVKPGGWIMGHDYKMNYEKAKNRYSFGVKQAVDEFCKEKFLSIHAFANDGCVSYAIKYLST